MKTIRLVILALSFGFTCLTNGTEVRNEDVARIMVTLNKIQQQFAPFANVSVEYTTEVEKDGDGKWMLYSRHQLIQNLRTDFFKKKSVTDHCVTGTGGLVLYEEMAWDGKLTKRFLSVVPREKKLEIKDAYSKESESGVIMSTRASSFSSFLYFYDNENLSAVSIYDAIRTSGREDMIFELEGDIASVTLKKGAQQLVFDVKTGRLLKKIKGIPSVKDSKFSLVQTKEFVIKKTALVEGRQIPIEFITTRYLPRPGGDRERVIVNPETIKFNIPEKDFDLTIKFPVGSTVSNSIENTRYTVSELDGESDLTTAKQTLDALIEKAKKEDKRE
jgi:hypothetical protein